MLTYKCMLSIDNLWEKFCNFFTKQPPPPATHHFFLLSVSVRGSSKSGGGDGGIGSSPQKDPQIGKFARVESLGTKRSYTKMLTPPEELAVHMAKINGTWVCTTCSSNFRDRTDCRRHVESRHITTTVYRCSRVRSLKSHTCNIGKLFFVFFSLSGTALLKVDFGSRGQSRVPEFYSTFV